MFFVLPVDEGKASKKIPLVNLVLISLNCYIFFKTATQYSLEKIIRFHGFIPAHPHFRDVVASMFLHAGLGHLLGNMYFLYVFGNKVEDGLGRVTYLFTYFLCGFGAVYLQWYINPHSTLPMIGASGAISGVCGLYMLMFPWQKMRWQFFFLIFPIFSIGTRALFVVGLWFLEQYFMASLSPADAGGVAFWAHVGGFLTGLILFPFIHSPKPAKN
jgi:membrane associated rhomboid family serine protease